MLASHHITHGQIHKAGYYHMNHMYQCSKCMQCATWKCYSQTFYKSFAHVSQTILQTCFWLDYPQCNPFRGDRPHGLWLTPNPFSLVSLVVLKMHILKLQLGCSHTYPYCKIRVSDAWKQNVFSLMGTSSFQKLPYQPWPEVTLKTMPT